MRSMMGRLLHVNRIMNALAKLRRSSLDELRQLVLVVR
jgi:lipopolysaccharide/colanic/teichoic acid biosynthesis glycosyltransferase